MHQSIATISSPEFINLQPLDINPLMSSCEIKVFYIGQNRNNSFITKEVATDMAKTLRGAPIVGYYKEEKEDFRDHGEKVIIDDEGVHFECMTVPYGFVSPDAQVWFQDFEDTDSFGNKVVRTYLMTTGYLWTEQFPECKVATDEGRPHSMELDEKTLKGGWEYDSSTGMDFFIINDATISKLCILGDDVEPCFEGSSVTSPQVSTSFSKEMDGKFKTTLFSMMKDLQEVINHEGGQTKMQENVENYEAVDAATEPEVVVETEVVEPEAEIVEEVIEPSAEISEPAAEFEKKDEEEEKKDEDKFEKKDEVEDKDEDKNEDETKDEDEDEGKEKPSKNTLEEVDYKALYTETLQKYEDLQKEMQELVEFKASVEKEKKEDLIDSFYMLSEEDKKDVRENIDTYSLDDIEAKLAILCVRNKVSFDLDETSKNEVNVTTTFSIDEEDSDCESSLPLWAKRVKENEKK